MFCTFNKQCLYDLWAVKQIRTEKRACAHSLYTYIQKLILFLIQNILFRFNLDDGPHALPLYHRQHMVTLLLFARLFVHLVRSATTMLASTPTHQFIYFFHFDWDGRGEKKLICFFFISFVLNLGSARSRDAFYLNWTPPAFTINMFIATRK